MEAEHLSRHGRLLLDDQGALRQIALQLVQETSLSKLLKRTLSVLGEYMGARYVAVGVFDGRGRLAWLATPEGGARRVTGDSLPDGATRLLDALRAAQDERRQARFSGDTSQPESRSAQAGRSEILSVPVFLAGKQVGAIYLADSRDEAGFSPEDIAVLDVLADYLGVAIQNAQRFEGLREREKILQHRNRDLMLLNQVGVTLASSLELDEILQRTLSLLMEYFRMEAGEIFLYEEENQSLRMVLHRGEAAQAFWTRTRFRLGEGIVGLAAQTLQSIVSDDLRREARFVREAIVQAGFRQIACVPLTARDRLKGVLSMIGRTRRKLHREDIRLLESVAGWAGMAIENAQLHYNARRLAVLEERERIGMDLHDGVMQAIYGVGLMLEETRRFVTDPVQVETRLGRAIENLNLIMRDMRSYILDLRPHQLRDENWLDGLRRLIAEFQQNTRLEIDFHVPKQEAFSRLPYAHALALFHVCQEALANVAKHAQAERVTVSLWAAADRVLLEVHDNGKGFAVQAVRRRVGHGLANMSTRLQQVGGDLEISSSPGEGTTILAWVPRRPAG